MSARILVLTAAFGEGHNAAARAVAAGFERNAGPGVARIHDAFALASPRFNNAARWFYLTLINHAPRLWSQVYDWIDRSSLVQKRLWIFRREIRVLAQLIGGIQSGMGYLGAANLPQLREKARYIRVSPAGQREAVPHDVVELKTGH